MLLLTVGLGESANTLGILKLAISEASQDRHLPRDR
jgi:hypothetical protein